MNGGDPLEWYNDIPIVSRLYLTFSFVTTAACALDLVSPFSLYFNYKLIVDKGQFWRLFTNFFFFGMFSVDFLFHMYFLVRYSRLLTISKLVTTLKQFRVENNRLSARVRLKLNRRYSIES